LGAQKNEVAEGIKNKKMLLTWMVEVVIFFNLIIFCPYPKE